MSDPGLLQTCRQCQHEFRVPATLIGKRLPCPHCQRLMEVGAVPGAKEDKLVGQVLGGCRLVRRLGAGAIGVVYEAEQLAMTRRVAIKMLSSKAASNPKLVQRFQREAKIAAQIQHPHVVSVYDCGFERSVHYLLMEYVDGTTLAGMVEEMGPLPWQQASQLILQVAQALDHVGKLNIVHRDIKPANILVASNGLAKLADLGMAKQIEEEGEGDGMGLTMQGVAMGSPAYMAPEQVRDAKQANHSADIYSLGATFYHVLSGQTPFIGRSSAEVMTKVLREEPRPLLGLLPGLPAGFAGLIHRTLAKDIAARPQDAGEFIAELNAVIAAPTQVRTTRRGVRASDPAPRGATAAARTAPAPAPRPVVVMTVVAALTMLMTVAWIVYANFFR